MNGNSKLISSLVYQQGAPLVESVSTLLFPLPHVFASQVRTRFKTPVYNDNVAQALSRLNRVLDKEGYKDNWFLEERYFNPNARNNLSRMQARVAALQARHIEIENWAYRRVQKGVYDPEHEIELPQAAGEYHRYEKLLTWGKRKLIIKRKALKSYGR